MTTFALIHGGGGSAWDWHLVVPELRKRGHEPVAVDLPCGPESAGWEAYVGAVVEAVAERPGTHRRRPFARRFHSAARLRAHPGRAADPALRDGSVPRRALRRLVEGRRLRTERVRRCLLPRRSRRSSWQKRGDKNGTRIRGRCASRGPSTSWPATPTRYLLCRGDRMFTAAWARRHARARLGIEADEMDGSGFVDTSAVRARWPTPPRIRREPDRIEPLASSAMAQRLWLTTSTLCPSGSRTNAP